jgi:diadenosine tetraphosphate (Ap4A) HIT family hydrolase
MGHDPILTPDPGCPFCDPSRLAGVIEAQSTRAFADSYPVTPGHMLVVPHRHVPSIFALGETEFFELWRMVGEVRSMLSSELGVEDFTVGVNDGLAAGQTVPHAHVHVIPRRTGDIPDPRGGIRWVIPSRAPYWELR